MFDAWSYFRETGNLEAYLLFKELQRLADGEYAQEFAAEKEEVHEREDARPDIAGNEYGRGR